LVFGTDFPFAPEAFMAASVAGLAELAADPDELEAVQRRNALSLFPRFAAPERS
jgi:predicted TIM-barrel fold metal-dependent hydrolase